MVNSLNFFRLHFPLLCVIKVSFGTDENEFGKTIGALLINFNSPLKLTTAICWNIESTVKFVKNINNDFNSSEANFQIKIMNDETESVPNIFERHQEVIIVDIKCNNGPNILAKINRYMFNFYKIIIFDSSVQESNDSNATMDLRIQKLFRESAILPMSQIFYIWRTLNNTFIIKQIYRPGLGEPLIVEEFGFYDGKELVCTTTMTPVIRRKNIKQFQLRASMVILTNDSINHLDDYRDIHVDAVSKLCYHLTNCLINYFINGTVKYSIVSTWGYKNPATGEWTGSLGELLRDEVDIASTPFFFTAERVAIMEYIACPSSAEGGFIFQAPKLSYTSNLYALPFDRLLWMCLLLLVIVIGVCLCGAMIIELKVFSTLEKQYRINDVAIIIFGALCQQGSSVVPHSLTAKIILAIAFIILMFLYVSYSANIVALLQSPSNQINTLQDLYDSKIDTSVEDNVYNRYYFPKETGMLRKNFYEHKLRNKDGTTRFVGLEEGIKKVREGLFAYYTEYSSAYKIISETFLDVEKCGLQEIPYFEMSVTPWYAIQKNSSYKEVLKIGMMRIQEHGIQHRENLKYYLSKPKCESGGGNFISATLTDTRPAMLILLWGFAITVVIFILELTVAHSSDIKYQISIFKEKLANKISQKD